MGNIIDYVQECSNQTFTEKPLNEVDALVLCQMVYMNFGPFVPGLDERNAPVSIQSIYQHPDRDRLLDDYWYRENNKELFEAAAKSVRFGSLKMNYYVNIINVEDETQFSAMIYILEDKNVFLAYRGTDATIIGWKEDLNLAFSKPLQSQHLAVEYMNKVAGCIAGGFYAGGHSKGGNLAVYAAMNCRERTREKLIHLYNNDGPGFRPEIRQQGNYDAIAGRMSKFVPRSSIVGMILEDQSDYEVVESRSLGLLQHNSYSWRVEKDAFVRADGISTAKRLRDESMNEWILSLSEEEIHAFVDTLYEVISASEASNVFEFGTDFKKSIQNVAKAAQKVDVFTKKGIRKTIHSFWEIAAENLRKEGGPVERGVSFLNKFKKF